MKKSPFPQLSPVPPIRVGTLSPESSMFHRSSLLPSVKSLLRKAFWASLVCLFCSLMCGCQVLAYTSPTGERFTRSSLGANTTIASLRVEADTNGVRRVELRGYQNDSTQALGIITEAAVRGALTA